MEKVKVMELIKFISSCGQDEIDLNSIIERFKGETEEEKLFKPADDVESTEKLEEEKEELNSYNSDLKSSNNFTEQEQPNTSSNLFKAHNTHYDNKNNEIIEEEVFVPYLELKSNDKNRLKEIYSELCNANRELHVSGNRKTKGKYYGHIADLRNEQKDIFRSYGEDLKSKYDRFKTDGDVFKTKKYNSPGYLQVDEFMSKVYVNPFVYKMFQKENEKLLWSQRTKMLASKTLRYCRTKNFDINSVVGIFKNKFEDEGAFRVLEHYFNEEIERDDLQFKNYLTRFIADLDTTYTVKYCISSFVCRNSKGDLLEYLNSIPSYMIKNSLFEGKNMREISESIEYYLAKFIEEMNSNKRYPTMLYRFVLDTLDRILY